MPLTDVERRVEAPNLEHTLKKKLTAGQRKDLSQFTASVYNQNMCGNCYAYATVNSISAQRAIRGFGYV
jgi:hypothetical protein